MKTNDWIQLGALGLVAYLAYQKFGQAKAPSTQLPVDFGVNNPNDPTWGGDPGIVSQNQSLNAAVGNHQTVAMITDPGYNANIAPPTAAELQTARDFMVRNPWAASA